MKEHCFICLICVVLFVSCVPADQLIFEDTHQTASAQTQIAVDLLEHSVMQTETAMQRISLTQDYKTLTPTPTLTLTPEPLTQAEVTIQANCRFGPDIVYNVVQIVEAGQTYIIVGKNTADSWWLVEIPDSDKTCWLSGSVITIYGDTSEIQLGYIPPRPTSVPQPVAGSGSGCARYSHWVSPASYFDFCVLSITVYPPGNYASVNVRWTAHTDMGYITRGACTADCWVYLVDNFGTQYSYTMGDSGALTVADLANGDSISGNFFFNGLNPNATSFDFVNLRFGFTIYGLIPFRSNP